MLIIQHMTHHLLQLCIQLNPFPLLCLLLSICNCTNDDDDDDGDDDDDDDDEDDLYIIGAVCL